MSDESKTPPESSPTPAPEAKPPPQKNRKWKRRMLLTFILFIALSLLLRLALSLLLPTVLRKIAAAYDLNCTYERSELNLLNGDAGLWHLAFAPVQGGDPVLKLDYVRGNISVLNLLRGRLDVWRMEADGGNVRVERAADGSIPLLDKILAVRKALASARDPAAPSGTPTGPVNLAPLFKIDAFRLSQLQVNFIDGTITPPLETILSMNVRVSDVQSPVRPISFSVSMWADPMLDQLRLEGTGHAVSDAIDATMRVHLYGLHPRPGAPYLRLLGIQPVAKSISLESSAQLTLKPVPAPAQAVQGSLVLENASIRADGVDSAVLDRLQIDADSISPRATRISQILVEGATLAAFRGESGNLRYAGLEFTSPTTQPSNSTLPDYDVTISKASLKKIRATFDDLHIAPHAALAWQIEDLTATNISTDLSAPKNAIEVSGRMSAPGISDSIQVSGQLSPGTTTQSLALKLSADSIKPDALKPYLDALGLQSELQNANFTLELTAKLHPQGDGKMVADAQFAKLRLSDGKDLMVMDDVKVGGLRIDLGEGLLSIDSIEIAGPSLQARRDETGLISALGMHGKAIALASAPQATASVPTTAPSAAPPAGMAIALPRLHIGKLNWKDIKLQFDDHMNNPPSVIGITDAGVELSNLTIDTRSPTTQPGTFRAWMTAPQIVEKLEAVGTFTPGANGLGAAITVDASGFTGNAIKPYLLSAGIEPNLTDGKLQLAATFNVSQAANGLDAALEVRDMHYADGGGELMGMDRLSMQGVTVRPDQLGVGTVSISAPRAVVARDAQGVFEAAGLRLVGHPSPIHALIVAPSTQPSAPLRLNLPIPIVLGSLDLDGANLTWKDRAVKQPIETTLTLSGTLSELVMGRSGASPAKFKVNLRTDGSLDDVTATGDLLAAPDQQRINVEISANGIRAAQLATYLPPGIEIALKDGKFRGNVSADLAAAEGGGQKLNLSAKSLNLSDGQPTEPLFKTDSFEISARRIDLNSGVIAIDRIVSQGVEADVHLTRDGNLQLPGLILSSPPPTTAPAEKSAAPPATATAGAPTDVSILVANARKPLPLITVETLDLGLARAVLRDDSRPDAAPVTVSDLRLRNLDKIQMGGPQADSQPPLQLDFSSRIDPLVNSVKVTTKATPLASEPAATIDVSLSGIQGDGITKLVPELSALIDGSKLTNGQFQSTVELQGKFARRGPAEIDFTKPFDLQFQVKGAEFRAEPGGPVLAGVQGIAAEGVHVDPAHGVVIRSFEITKPIGEIWRDDAGIHAGGILVKIPTASTTAPSTAPSNPPQELAQRVQPATRPSAEYRIDRLIISGLDFTAEDRSFDPPVFIPLTGLDVEVCSLSNMVLYEDRPVRFNAVVNSGQAPLPSVREGEGGKVEPRELFSQVTASGVVSLYPKPSGWTKASVNGFELVSLRGVAHEFGVTLGKGIFDTRADLRLTGEGDTIQAKTRTQITDLRVSEPAGGPIQKALGLPGTLDLAIGVVEDVDGSITLPVEVPIHKGQISGSDIMSAAIGATGAVIATAMVSAPLKATAGVTNMIGLGGPQAAAAPEEPVELKFAPGSTTLDPSQLQQLSRVLERMRKDENTDLTLRHELGGGDLTRASLRANPSPSEAENLAHQLHQRKLELLRERSSLAGRARVELAALPPAASAKTLAQLQELDTEIALTEDALDNAGELLKPGADRQATRRARAAALELAKGRMDVVSAYLAQNSTRIKNASDRISTINPTLNPADGDDGGKIVITIITKKR